MHIDKFKQPDGSYLDAEGCSHDDAVSFLHCHVLGFCGCGNPEDSLRYVRDSLQHIDMLTKVHEKAMTYEAWDEAGTALMGSARYFTLYVLAEKELTQHGGSVGGAWLTPKGREILEDLNSLLEDNQIA
jgi:hypothetical protein